MNFKRKVLDYDSGIADNETADLLEKTQKKLTCPEILNN